MSLIKLQTKIGVVADGSFGPGTLKAIGNHYKLNNNQLAHFCGQVSHETGNFKIFVENLNYSASGLLTTFPKYFNSTNVESYARQPIKIGNRVYANRMGNGDETSGDGYKYRGRGALQTTGKANYQALANSLSNGLIMTNPDLVMSDYAFEAALFFFETNKLWSICDKGVDDATIKQLTQKINGGQNGYNDRLSLTKKYYSWLK